MPQKSHDLIFIYSPGIRDSTSNPQPKMLLLSDDLVEAFEWASGPVRSAKKKSIETSAIICDFEVCREAVTLSRLSHPFSIF